MDRRSWEQSLERFEDHSVVSIDPKGIERVVALMQPQDVPDWTWILPASSPTPLEAGVMFVFNAMLNGGYHDERGFWSLQGSGSAALQHWIETVVFPLPYGQGLSRNQALQIAHSTHPQPYHAKRFEAIMAYQERFNALRHFFQQRLQDQGRLEIRHALELAKILPEGFGEDPFSKKACLALYLWHGWLQHHHLKTVCSVPIPADYRMPQIFQWLGALRPTVAWQHVLQDQTPLEMNDHRVHAWRYAGLMVAKHAALKAGISEASLDAQLFMRYRRLAQERGLPALIAHGFWF